MAFRLSKKVNNAIYGYGAAIVIIGALMKITYFSPDWAPGSANTMLTIGLVIEALIFAYSADFDGCRKLINRKEKNITFF